MDGELSVTASPKLLIIGLDGATFSVLEPLIKAGFLPHLERLLANSATFPLLSTIPPITALAWPTLMTGKNPGKHGLLGWQEPLNDSFDRPWANARKVHGPMIWHYLNAASHRVCVANVPVTYPPEPIRGLMVTGMLTPHLDTEFTYPATLKQELLSAIPDYQIDLDVQRTHRHRYGHKKMISFLEDAQEVTKMRGRSFRWLLSRENPNVGIFVFETPDRLQHLLWRHIAKLPEPVDKSAQMAELRKSLVHCYQVLDDEVSKLLDDLDESGHVVLLSDHGFGPIEANVHLNDWLARQGWLKYSKYLAGGWNVLRTLGRYFKGWVPNRLVIKTKETIPLHKTLDWSKTIAYAGLPSENGVFLNCYGREPAGIVSEEEYETLRSQIIEALSSWRHPEDNRPVMKAVYRREDVYNGPHVTLAPDIVFELERGFYISDLTAPSPGKLFTDVSEESWGFHEREGIFAMSGPGIKPAKMDVEAHLVDVLPTIFYALDLPLPEDIDGRPLTEIFTNSWQRSHDIKVGLSLDSMAHLAEEDDTGYSKSEEEMIAERLRNLGYLGE